MVKLPRHDLGYFFGKKFFGNNGFQNMFIYQPFNTLEFKNKKNNSTDYVIC